MLRSFALLICTIAVGCTAQPVPPQPAPPDAAVNDSVADWTFFEADPDSPKLDDAEWHMEAAEAAGAGEDADGVHIAYFLGWAFGRGALTDEATDEDGRLPDALRQREPSALLRLLYRNDGKLFTTMLKGETAVFARACYDAYLNAYPSLVARAGKPWFHVPTWEAFDEVSAGLDELFERWHQQGCS